MNYRAVIFDLDGTLLNTLDDLGNAMNRTLEHEGFPTHSIDAYRYFVGNGVMMLVKRALPEEHRDDETIQQCLTKFMTDYQQHCQIDTRPYEGIAEMLDALAARGLKMAVLSNKPDAEAKRCVADLLTNWSFEVVLGHREGMPHKPDPAGAQEIAEQFQLPPSEILYVGDTATDMQTALAARMFPVGVLWGFRSREELVQSGARAVVEHPLDIASFLKVE
jgi:phosphoglycolate phosphatase